LPGGNAIIDIPAVANNLTMASIIGGAGGFTKTGTGNLTLTGGNTFTGPLIIAAGKLLSGSGIIPDTVPVIINAGATWEVSDSDSFGSLSGAGTLAVNSGSQRNPGL
jgi:autotransporter-associated beta strand protein